MQQANLFTRDQLPPGGPRLSSLRSRMADCQACALRATCKQPVFGEGLAPDPLVAFVGEGPGKEEDELNRPFIGKAGKLLDKMIEAIGLKREQVYLCNVVGCRPPENRTPTPKEIEACREFLVGQLRAVRPFCIVTLGTTATEALVTGGKGAQAAMGRWHEWEGIPLRSTYHPAYLSRDPSKKVDAWLDLQAVMLKLKAVRTET